MAQLDSPAASPVVDSDSFSSLTHPEDPSSASGKPMAAPTAPPPAPPSQGGEKAPKPAEEPIKPKRGRGRPRKNPDAPPKPPRDPNAPKRPRGRPRKHPLPPEPDPPAAIPAAVPIEPNRPVGRPRKHPLPPEPDPPAAIPAAVPIEPKRPVGRPRKHPLPPASEVQSQAPVVKRKRGRPRKTPLVEPAAPVQTVQERDDQNKPATGNPPPTEPSGDTSAAAPVKKRRGRPRKVPVETTTAAKEGPKETTDGQMEPPKKKRGRPKKNPLPDSNGPSPAKQSKVQTKDGEGEPTKKKRGRPRKVQKAPPPEATPPQPAGGGRGEKQETDPAPEFHLVTFEDSSSDGEVGENIASLVSRNGVLQDKEPGQPVVATEQHDKEQGAESSDSSYMTPDP